jgi:hypothetical protein
VRGIGVDAVCSEQPTMHKVLFLVDVYRDSVPCDAKSGRLTARVTVPTTGSYVNVQSTRKARRRVVEVTVEVTVWEQSVVRFYGSDKDKENANDKSIISSSSGDRGKTDDKHMTNGLAEDNRAKTVGRLCLWTSRGLDMYS